MDRLISEQSVIETIEFFQMNPQHFDFVNLIDDIKEIPSAEPKTDVLDKIKGYIDHIRNTGMGKKKSLEFIEKFIEGLKAEMQ